MKNIALLFPGQGSQYAGMGKTLSEEFDIANNTFDEANEILGFDLKKLCFSGRLSELSEIEKMQPAILTVSVASFRVYMQEIGIEPKFMAGHSLGEYSALVCSGALNFQDALKIVQKRSTLVQNVTDRENGMMTIVEGIDEATVEEECKKASKDGKVVAISCYNSFDQFSICGHQDAVMDAGKKLKQKGANVTSLIIGGALSHCCLMESASNKLRNELKKQSYNELMWPVISNSFALPYNGMEEIIQNLSTQLIKPVRWTESIDYMHRYGVEVAIEIGPQNVLSNLMRRYNESIKIFTYDKKKDKKDLKDSLFLNRNTFIIKLLALATTTRNRNKDDDEYKKGVIEPYKKIYEIKQKLSIKGSYPEIKHMEESLELIYTILQTKKVPIDEQIRKLKIIFEQTGTTMIFTRFIDERYSAKKNKYVLEHYDE